MTFRSKYTIKHSAVHTRWGNPRLNLGDEVPGKGEKGRDGTVRGREGGTPPLFQTDCHHWSAAILFCFVCQFMSLCTVVWQMTFNVCFSINVGTRQIVGFLSTIALFSGNLLSNCSFLVLRAIDCIFNSIRIFCRYCRSFTVSREVGWVEDLTLVECSQLFTCKLGGRKLTHSGKSPTHSRHFVQMG